MTTATTSRATSSSIGSPLPRSRVCITARQAPSGTSSGATGNGSSGLEHGSTAGPYREGLTFQRAVLASPVPAGHHVRMSSQAACPGPCNKRYREAEDAWKQALADYDPLDADQSRPEAHSVTPWPGEPVWCTACAGTIGLKLAELDDLAARLAAEADGHRDSTGLERVTASAEPASPSPAADALDEMHGMLSTWETIYRGIRGWQSPPPRGDLASKETACIDWLRRHLKGILADPGIGEDFGREILQWHRESAGSAKAGVRTLRKPLRCPSCRFLTLFWTEGEQSVSCKNDNCGRILSLADYEAEVDRQSAALQRGELDAEELAATA